MNRLTRRTIKAATLLSDARPTFVSLVRHGANQTPFRTIKSADPTTMSKPATIKKSITLETGVEIHIIKFDANRFSEDTVKKYLDENGFSGYALERKGDLYEVPGIDASEFVAAPAEVEIDEGVSMFVGKIKTAEPENKEAAPAAEPDKKAEATPATPPVRQRATPEQKTGEEGGTPAPEAAPAATPDATPAATPAPAAEATPAATPAPEATPTEQPPVVKTAKGDSLVKKWSYYACDCSKDKTLAEVLSDALNDGVPLGYHEVMATFHVAIINSLRAGEVANIKAITTELGDFLTKLAELSKQLSEDESPTAKAMLDAVLPPEKTPETENTTKSATPGEGEPTATALKAALDRIAALETKTDGIAGRVTGIEKLRSTQKRQSADVGDLAPPAEPAKKGEGNPTETDISKMSKSEKNLLGIRD